MKLLVALLVGLVAGYLLARSAPSVLVYGTSYDGGERASDHWLDPREGSDRVRHWYGSGALASQEQELGDPGGVEHREWFDQEPGAHEPGGLRALGYTLNGLREGRWAVWNYDGSIDAEQSGTYFRGDKLRRERSLSVADLERLLDANEAVLRAQAARCLGYRGDVGSLPVLGKALQDEDGEVRRSAADAIGEFGPEAAELVPRLTHALQELDPTVPRPLGRDEARSLIVALGRIGSPAASSLPTVVPFGAGALELRYGKLVVEVIGAMGSAEHGALEHLLEVLSDADRLGELHKSVIESLSLIGDPAVQSLEGLLWELERCQAAARALARMGTPSARAALRRALAESRFAWRIELVLEQERFDLNDGE